MRTRLAVTVGASLLALAAAAQAQEPPRSVAIDAGRLPSVRKIDERFQSFQIGMSHLTGGETWKSYDALPKGRKPEAPGDVSAVREARPAADLTNRRLRNLTAALGPLYIRYSGTTANSVYFQDDDKPRLDKAPDGFTVVLTRAAWKRGLDFAKAVDAKVLTGFAVSPGVRDASGAWTPKTAAPWLAYTRAAGGEIYAAELYNEPNAPEPPHYPKGHAAAEYARDFAAFRAFMATERALSEEWLSRPDKQFQRHKALRDRYAPGAPIWISETGAAACGGPKWQPTFLDTFRYLDTQARLAKQGVDATFTHALISGSNGVIDEKTFLPNADYWAALLWRKLMGTQVLDAGATQPGLHLYAHCQRGAAGGVTLLAINLETTPATVRVSGAAQLYALTAPELQSRTVLLNGKPLALGPGDTVPKLTPARVRGGEVPLAPTSVNFITLPQAGHQSCSV